MTTYYVVQKRLGRFWDDWDDLGSTKRKAEEQFRRHYFSSKADVGAFRLVKRVTKDTRLKIKLKRA